MTIDVLCYYSPEFTSTLLSDNDVLLSNKNASNYVGQSMLEFFEQRNLTRWKRYQFPTYKDKLLRSVNKNWMKLASNRLIIMGTVCFVVLTKISTAVISIFPESFELDCVTQCLWLFLLVCRHQIHQRLYSILKKRHTKRIRISGRVGI